MSSTRWPTISVGSLGQSKMLTFGSNSGSCTTSSTTRGASTTSLAGCRQTLTTSGSGSRSTRLAPTRQLIILGSIGTTRSNGIGRRGMATGASMTRLTTHQKASCFVRTSQLRRLSMMKIVFVGRYLPERRKFVPTLPCGMYRLHQPWSLHIVLEEFRGSIRS